MLSLNNLMSDEGDALTYSQRFRRVLETHMGWLRLHPSTYALALDSYSTYKYEGDLYGYLSLIKINRSLHWVIMRLNNMTAPTQFDGKIRTLLIPSDNLIDEIKRAHLTIEKKMS